MPITPRVVAITGASSGIGAATAELLASRGDAVALFARRADRLEAIAERIRASGGRAIAVPGDVRQPAALRDFVADATSAFGRLDVMICNAGIGYHGTLDDTPPEVMRRLVETNVLGTLYAADAAIAVFRRQGAGHVIAVSSIVGRRGVPGASVYAATKAAQAGLIESLRAEFVGSELRASIIYPVGVETEFREAQRRDYGRDVRGHGPRQSAAHVARRIAACIASPRAEVYPYAPARALAVLNAVAPATADRLARRFGRRIAPPADPGAGPRG
jgi:NADP-dependent 3-hydroxy acid dehydrogenase YdfG